MTLVDNRKIEGLRLSRLIFWALGLLIVFSYGCNKPQSPITELSGASLGTTYSVKISATLSTETSEQLHQLIKTQLEEIDQSMSVFYEDSEISRFNAHDRPTWFKLSPAMFEVVKESARISELSKGAFDYTLGNLIELWGFGKKMKLPVIPGASDIAQAQLKSGYMGVQVDTELNSIRKEDPKVALNLSAIAKGYAVDRVAKVLENEGFRNYLVEIGGEIRVSGMKKEGSPWLVAVERPDFSRRSIQKIIKLGDKAMATSGDYRNYFEIEGKRFSHTMDAKTGRPVENNIASVSVIADTCMEADALATALVVLGFEKGKQFAEEQKLAVFWILRTDSTLLESMTPEFEQYVN